MKEDSIEKILIKTKEKLLTETQPELFENYTEYNNLIKKKPTLE